MSHPAATGLLQALHPLAQPPLGMPWNLAELDGLLPPAPLREAGVLLGLLHRPLGQTTGSSQDHWHVLLTRRTESLRHHPGQVSFPGGRVEATDADTHAAVLREAYEEIGLDAQHVRPLGWLDPLATITGFRVLPLVAEITPEFVPQPDPGEVAEVFEVSLSALMQPANLQRQTIHVRGSQRQVLHYDDALSPGRQIWGATASILFNLRERLSKLG